MMTYQDLLKGIKIRIRLAQLKAVMSANAEMLMLYWAARVWYMVNICILC